MRVYWLDPLGLHPISNLLINKKLLKEIAKSSPSAKHTPQVLVGSNISPYRYTGSTPTLLFNKICRESDNGTGT